MSYAPTFVGTPDANGRFPEPVRQDIARAMKLFAGVPTEVEIRRFVRKRSNPQNAYLHAVPFPILAEFFGDSIEETKRTLMGECWGWKRAKRTRRLIPVRRHTSEMNVEEAMFFIDWLLPWALTKWGIAIPLPNEEQRTGKAA